MNQPIPDVQGEQDHNESACRDAAFHNSLTRSQADECNDGEHGCPFCPWRKPLSQPAEGDQLILHDGRLIEVEFVNLQHCESPRVSYSFVEWIPPDGGRKTYSRKLSEWAKLVRFATVKRVGKKPSLAMKMSSPGPYHERMTLFEMRNGK